MKREKSIRCIAEQKNQNSLNEGLISEQTFANREIALEATHAGRF